MLALLIDRTDDYADPDIHGPFITEAEANRYAERWRKRYDVPPTEGEWEDEGWRFLLLTMRMERG